MIFLGYIDQSNDDLEIVSTDVSKVIKHLKNKTKNEFEFAYVDVWENDTINIERIPLTEFELKYSL